MSTQHEATTPDLLTQHKRWMRRRGALARLEGMGKYPRANDWHASDDDAIDLMDGAMFVVKQVHDMFNKVCEAHVMNMDSGAGFTCDEAEAIFDCMVLVGASDCATQFMIAHAGTDNEEGDMHRQVMGEEPWRPGVQVALGWEYTDLDDES